MITYPGYDDLIANIYTHQQNHVFAYWETLSDAEKKQLLDQLSTVDFNELNNLFQKTSIPELISSDYSPAPYTRLPQTAKEVEEYRLAEKTGIEFIKQGKVAAFIVAGGQGSRLGYEGPKGKYPIGPVSKKSLFQIHAEKILAYSQKYDISIPWLIMTSEANYTETEEFIRENQYFGLQPKDVIIFKQKMLPSMDTNGKLILSSKCEIFRNPDGHGGSLTALQESGALTEMKRRGIEIISYFQVDNPLIKIIDPLFIGFHLLNKADISSKALLKAYAEEKIGVFVKFANNRIGVVEYSDLPKEKMELKDSNDELSYAAGSIAIHLFNVSTIDNFTSGKNESLPFHVAKKKIKAYVNHTYTEIDGFKFEKFVFDALPMTSKNFIMETTREEEFAPVKNKSGVDSPESCHQMMTILSKKWLDAAGINIPGKARLIEISPLVAVEGSYLKNTIVLPDEEEIYLG